MGGNTTGGRSVNNSQLFTLISEIGGKVTTVNENVSHVREQTAVLQERIEQNQQSNEKRWQHLEEKMSSDRESIQKINSEIDALRGEIKQISNNSNGSKIEALERRMEDQLLQLKEHATHIKELQETRAKAAGALQLGQGIWALIGGIVIAVIIAALKL